MRAVAKGARKPSSSFAARLELYSVVDVLCSKGRNLDIVKEARLVTGNEVIRRELEFAASAAPMVELLDRVTQSGLENPRLFALTEAALLQLNRADTIQAPALCAAHLLKALAFLGLRPCLTSCVGCGSDMTVNRPDALVFVSYREGGVVCSTCRTHMEALAIPAASLDWCRVFLGSTFAEILKMEVDLPASFAALRFCQQWIREHVGVNLKSLTFLFTSGLF